ncbi:YopX family protein [Streptococcus mitis]|uniref:YopX family protein n=1 Tax=Streptococcus mitis TaxID=28037 RepID=UPI00098A0A8F|nr:YopX family protein [Streptococcus mitis]
MIPKFRAWDRTRNEMNYKVMVGNCDLSDENWTCPIIWIEERKKWLHFDDDYECIMQSTGLRDKKGKEIFEGDILACETDDEVINLNVFWDEEHALFMFESKKYNEQELLAELVENNTYPFEIIGNIYENPELLEDKE